MTTPNFSSDYTYFLFHNYNNLWNFVYLGTFIFINKRSSINYQLNKNTNYNKMHKPNFSSV